MNKDYKLKSIERFLRFIKINKYGCHIWQSSFQKNGYGQFCMKGLTTLAHRASYILFKGVLDKNLCVLHKCDNRKCVNPEHLFLGTRYDNYIDSKIKGRNCKGQSHGCSKLTNQKIIVIRKKLKKGYSNKDLAVLYDVSPTTIHEIKSGKTWKHLK